jgi:hypothetical protein
MYNGECCGTCEYGSYDKMQGYVCVNDVSEYVADFVDYDHVCDSYEEKHKHEYRRKRDNR